MLDTTKRTIATLTAAACLGAGGWAIAASSAPSSGTSATDQATAQANPTTPQAGYGAPTGTPPQRSDETPLTGDAAAKAKAAALAKLPGATVVRVETDADSGGAYEAHVTRSDGTPATVLMDSDFSVTQVLEH